MVRIGNKTYEILVILYFIISILVSMFIKVWYDLYRYRQCVDNNFYHIANIIKIIRRDTMKLLSNIYRREVDCY